MAVTALELEVIFRLDDFVSPAFKKIAEEGRLLEKELKRIALDTSGSFKASFSTMSTGVGAQIKEVDLLRQQRKKPMPLNFFKRKPKVLKDLDIDEVSAVSAGANPLAKVVLLKRDRAALKNQIDNATARLAVSVESIVSDPSANKNEMLATSFGQYLDHVGKLTGIRIPPEAVVEMHKIFGIAKNDSERAEPDLSNSAAGMPRRRRRRDVDDDERESDAGGESADQLVRAESAMKGNNMTREEELSNFVKRSGIAALARAVNEKGAFLTEEEYSKLLYADCSRTGRDFSKALEGGRFGDPENAEIAKAWRALRDAGFASRQATMSKAATLEPRFVGGADARNVDNSKAALDQINELVAIQRKNNPTLSEAQAFAEVYAKNPSLAEQERKENRPVAAWGG